MKSRLITSQEADAILRQWERLSSQVCFAICVGELAWNAHWVGRLREGALTGHWIHVDGHTTNMLSTSQYQEITFTEDDDLVGIRFRLANGAAPSFEVDLFVDKHDSLDEAILPLMFDRLQSIFFYS